MNLASIKPQTREIPLGLLDPPRNPSRVEIDEDYILELAANIRANGLLQPLIVAPRGERYEIIAGDCRSRACRKAGLVAVECRVYPTFETALIAIQYAENRFRKDLSAAEEAILFSDLLERDCGGDVDVLCDRLAETRSYVEGRLLLFQGCQAVFAALMEQKIKLGVAQKLNEIDDDKFRHYYLDAAIRGGATVAVVAGWVQQWKLDRAYTPGAPAPAPSAAPTSPVPETHYFVCACCRGTENVHLMRPINVHDYCQIGRAHV